MVRLIIAANIWVLFFSAFMYGQETEVNVCTSDSNTCTSLAGSVAAGDLPLEHNESECTDQHANCSLWANKGECDANPYWMHDFCRVSCGTCHSHAKKTLEVMEQRKCTSESTCEDCDLRCATWTAAGECHANPGYMRSFCAVSCGLCKAGDPHPSEHPDCQDKHAKCKRLAAAGACHTQFSMMMRECQRSCRVCGDLDPCRPNASDDGVVQMPGDLNKLLEAVIRKENVSVLSSDPYVILLHDAISDGLVDEVTQVLSSDWERSIVGGVHGSDERDDAMRTSEQQWCQNDCEKSAPVEELTRRVESLIGIHRRHFDWLQVLRYQAGQYYRPHTDFVPEHATMPVGPRVLTFFLYLKDVEGGDTRFPYLNISVPPRKGSALLWPSVLDSDPFSEDTRTLHEGRPPLDNSSKLAMNFWVHQYSYRHYSERHCLWAHRPRSSYSP